MNFFFDSIANELSSFSDVLDGYDNSLFNRKEIYCKKCGTKLSYFMDTGFVGCANCYETFKDYAEELARNIHGRINHVGKVPKGEATRSAKKRELERLILEKEQAAKNEDYIRANEIKIQIARLREELK